MKRIVICFPEGKTKALTMSYDDGSLQDERLVDIFNRNHIKATFNLSYGFLEQGEEGGHISPERVKSLYEGHEVATHTLTHPTLTRCPITAVAEEILEDRKNLEKIVGGVVRGHAYPNGAYNEEIKKLFAQLGIAYARVVPSSQKFELPTDFMEWQPTCHHNDPNLMKLAEEFAEFKKRQYLKLMYVWGHSYEFDINDNWEVMEEFCSYMGGREDIWYATNIEIADYCKALSQLQFTACRDGVYNPCAKSVWLMVEETCVKIPGGSFVTL